MKAYFSALLLAGSLAGHAQSGQQAARIKQVENSLIPYVPVQGFAAWKLPDRMRYHKVPGTSVAVIRNYAIDWTQSYGLADTTRRVAATDTTLYSAGSISKLVTAVIALQLVEAGKMQLDSPINLYLRSWKLAENDFTRAKPVTLRMLLSHTGGTSQTSYFGFTPDRTSLPTTVEILSGAPAAESRPVVVNSEPGKEFRYSGGGYMVVQLAITDLLQDDFATIAQRMVFDPLQMRHASFRQPLSASQAAMAAWGYSAAPWYKGMPYVYPQQAAAGLYSTATDLALLIIELQKCFAGKGTLLNAATVQQMFTPQATISTGAYREEMGLGAFLLEREDNQTAAGKYFEHQGANAGFIAYAMGSVEGGNGVVILMNTGDDFNGFGKELRRAVAQVYGWENFLPQAIRPVKKSQKELDVYTGRYRMGNDEVVYIRKEKDYLVENINEGPDIYCFPVGKDSIVFTDFNVKGWFGRDAAGKVVSLQSAYQDKPMAKMRADEFAPSELLRQKKYAAAKEAFGRLNLNEYQITYKAYELLNKKPFDPEAAKAMLELAIAQHPRSAIVRSRWGDYYRKLNDRVKALSEYQAAVSLDPSDEQAKEAIRALAQ
ncbi:serine hydrolase domain-containing protein [Cnuella takakiae]|nr:serine hydrolase domain-containing protein [Cnuella takakiae]OLY90849.1 hypothetical protein BUE76_02270 [Cnuella takakiae]